MMPIYYCDQCRVARGLPKTELTKTAVQCSFCDRNICKCHESKYAEMVGLDRNQEMFKTFFDSIRVSQPISLPEGLPITKIHPNDKKVHMNDKMVIVFKPAMGEDKSHNIVIVNRHTGEQIQVQM